MGKTDFAILKLEKLATTYNFMHYFTKWTIKLYQIAGALLVI